MEVSSIIRRSQPWLKSLKYNNKSICSCGHKVHPHSRNNSRDQDMYNAKEKLFKKKKLTMIFFPSDAHPEISLDSVSSMPPSTAMRSSKLSSMAIPSLRVWAFRLPDIHTANRLSDLFHSGPMPQDLYDLHMRIFHAPTWLITFCAVTCFVRCLLSGSELL